MDRAHKILVMVISCMVTIFNMGFILSFGTLFLAMMQMFQTNRATTAIVQALLIGMALGFGAVSGVLISRIGLRSSTFAASVMVTAGMFMSFFATSIYFLYISIGIVTGIGISMSFISCLTLVGQTFSGPERLYYISAINIAIPVGAFIYPYVLEWLRDSYGLHGTFLILSGIVSNTFALFIVCFMSRTKNDKLPERPLSNDEIITLYGDKQSQNQAQLKSLFSIPFISLLIGLGISMGGFNGFIQLLLDISIWKGLTKNQGLASFVAYHSVSVIARMLPAILNQTKNISAFICAATSAFAGCCGQLVLYCTSGITSYYVGILLSSVAVGGLLSSSLIIVVEMVRQEQKPLAYGLLYTLNGVLSTTAGYALGKARDVTGSYTLVICTVGGMQFIATILFIIGFIFWKRRSRTIVVGKTSNGVLMTSEDDECNVELTSPFVLKTSVDIAYNVEMTSTMADK